MPNYIDKISDSYKQYYAIKQKKSFQWLSVITVLNLG